MKLTLRNKNPIPGHRANYDILLGGRVVGTVQHVREEGVWLWHLSSDEVKVSTALFNARRSAVEALARQLGL